MIYILCPEKFATGGTELLHQLCYKINKFGKKAKMCYTSISTDDPVAERFKKYKTEYVSIDKIEDIEENEIIIPEVMVEYVLRYKNIKKYIWWLSVDNYARKYFKINYLKYQDNKLIFKNFRKWKREKVKINSENILHLVQSKYAEEFLKENKVSKIEYLSDYLNEEFLKEKVEFNDKNRKNIILYNPKKGIEFTKKIMEKFPEYTYIALENMTPTQIIKLCKISKIYIDFGNHPGKDRFPREAAILGCVVITGKRGSAKYYEDVMIDEKYKFKENKKEINKIGELIKEVFDNYNERVLAFDNYREKIKKEEKIFELEMKKVFFKESENKKYNYLIVGAGLYGSIFAYEMAKQGKKCLVIDKRNHIGGNIYTENIEGINTHKYGAHIFHTNDKEIWDYINQFAEFNNYINAPIANYKGEIYNLPFNMNTFNKLWGVITPKEAKKKIEEQKKEYKIVEPKNLEEQAISLIGKDIYEKLVKGYTEKQWGRKATELPAFIIKRLPVRFTYDNNYFNDRYQGIPIGGYTQIIEKMLKGIEVRLSTNFFENKEYYKKIADKIIFTGMIDEFYNYQFGKLEYRSLKFETEVLNEENYQGNAVVNYTEREIPYTRVIEHKYFEFGKQEKTVITKEYPIEWKEGEEPYYPVNDEGNNKLYEKYKELSKQEKRVIFGGRLGEYKYYDMDKVIKEVLNVVRTESSNKV